MSKMHLVGNRVPQAYFRTSGVGESDVTEHAGSYHLALREAGIENCNIITYSSILPRGSYEVEHPGRESFVHGEVMETITAEASCQRGETATAGLISAELMEHVGDRSSVIGGLVCEYNGPLQDHEAEVELEKMLVELHTNGYEQYELVNKQLQLRTVTPTKMFGTALVALCFTTYAIKEI